MISSHRDSENTLKFTVKIPTRQPLALDYIAPSLLVQAARVTGRVLDVGEWRTRGAWPVRVTEEFGFVCSLFELQS